MSSVKFCPECNNMLYPKEDRMERKLYYACRNCEHQEDASEFACIYRHQIMHSSSEQTQMVSDVAVDPTLPRTKSAPCPKCGHRISVFFQSRARRADTNMTLYYVCGSTSCGHRWVDEQVHGTATSTG